MVSDDVVRVPSVQYSTAHIPHHGDHDEKGTGAQAEKGILALSTIQTGSKEVNCVGVLSIFRRISGENRPEAAPLILCNTNHNIDGQLTF